MKNRFREHLYSGDGSSLSVEMKLGQLSLIWDETEECYRTIEIYRNDDILQFISRLELVAAALRDLLGKNYQESYFSDAGLIELFQSIEEGIWERPGQAKIVPTYMKWLIQDLQSARRRSGAIQKALAFVRGLGNTECERMMVDTTNGPKCNCILCQADRICDELDREPSEDPNG